jgi:hypothetical protein
MKDRTSMCRNIGRSGRVLGEVRTNVLTCRQAGLEFAEGGGDG